MSTKRRILLGVAIPIILVDQLTKWWVVQRFELYESMVLINGFFSFTYILNPGAAFGFMADQSELFRAIFFSVVSVFALILLAFYFRDTPAEDRISVVAISLLFGGAIGNIIDRVRLGEVVDFLDFYIGKSHWPAFNVADSSITVGISLLMVHMLLQKKEASEGLVS